MKNSILLLSMFMSAALLSDELSWVDEQVQAIKPARQGMQNHNLNIIKDPFIFLAKNRGEDILNPPNKRRVVKVTPV